MPPRDQTVVLENVQLRFRNFAGREGMYNREGDRNFAVELPKDVAEDLAAQGWNVKLRKPREDDEDAEPQHILTVAVSYKGRSKPIITMIGSKSGRRTQLDEDSVEVLDYVDILQTDLMIRPYDWAVSGNTGRKAYLQSLYVTIIEDPLQLKYGDQMIATVEGPMMEHTEPLHVPSERAEPRQIESGKRR